MKNGIILPSDKAPFGFHENLFDGWLWKIRDAIWISFIISYHPGKGNFNALIRNILAEGFTVKIPTPLGQMERIVRKNGYTKNIENTDIGECEVWTLKPTAEIVERNGEGQAVARSELL
jgi:hypothetical protein